MAVDHKYSKPKGKKGFYEYRRRVPSDLVGVIGLSHWKVALRTADPFEALLKERETAAEHDGLIGRHRGASEADKLRRALNVAEAKAGERVLTGIRPLPLSPQQQAHFDKATALKAKLIAKATQAIVLKGLSDDEKALIELAGGVGALMDDVEIADAFDLANEEMRVDRDAILLEPDEVIDPVTARMRQLSRDLEKAHREVNRRERSEARKVLRKLDLIDEKQYGPEDPTNPRIETVLNKWLAHKGQGPQAARKHRVAIRRFVEKFGNVPVKDVTQKMVLDFREYCQTIPDVRRLPTKQRLKPVEDLNTRGVPTIASNTVDRHLGSIKAILQWATTNVPDFGTFNVARGIVAAADTRKQHEISRAFTADEMRLVLENVGRHYDFTRKRYQARTIDMGWLVWLGAYSGARLEELCQLARDNIRQVRGRWVLDINSREGRRLKNDFSERLVPVHPVLIETGFIEWAKKGSGPRVFMSFELRKSVNGSTYGGPASASFGKFLDKLKLTDRALKFHSLRHTFIEALRNAEAPYSVELALVGHQDKISRVHGNYGGSAGLDVLAKYVERVEPTRDR